MSTGSPDDPIMELEWKSIDLKYKLDCARARANYELEYQKYKQRLIDAARIKFQKKYELREHGNTKIDDYFPKK